MPSSFYPGLAFGASVHQVVFWQQPGTRLSLPTHRHHNGTNLSAMNELTSPPMRQLYEWLEEVMNEITLLEECNGKMARLSHGAFSSRHGYSKPFNDTSHSHPFIHWWQRLPYAWLVSSASSFYHSHTFTHWWRSIWGSLGVRILWGWTTDLLTLMSSIPWATFTQYTE